MYDREKETGILNSEKEEKLNELGIFDDQIESMNQETIDNIEKHEIVDASNEYYQVDEQKGTLVRIGAERIDKVIGEQYKDEIEKVSSNGILSHIYNLWNPKAKAATIRGYDYSKKSVNSGILQQGVMVTTTGETGKLRVWYKATWITSPHCRGIDICGVYTSFGTPLVDTINTTYYYDYTVRDISPRGSVVRHEKNTVIPNYYYKSNGVIVSQNLYSQWKKIEASTLYPFAYTLDEYIQIEYDLAIPKSKYKDYNMVLADYWHKKDSTTYTINPTFSSDGTISLGLSSDKTSTYIHISPNLAANFTYSSGNK